MCLLRRYAQAFIDSIQTARYARQRRRRHALDRYGEQEAHRLRTAERHGLQKQ